MRFLSALTLGALASQAVALVPRSPPSLVNAVEERTVEERDGAESRTPLIKQTKKIQKYIVNGTGLPDVDFDIGESYAGLMPINDKPNSPELYFWFFPTDNKDGQDEITIWLNGGPGCSSLEGFFQENGPVLWQYGTFKPVKNPWTWVKLTNMIWVEQPLGTGFSQGTPTATNEKETAAQFLGFFKNFIDTFGLKNKKIYIAGESYAGYYVPYIADAMLDKKDKTYYNLIGSMIYDPVTSYDVVQTQLPLVPFIEKWDGLFALNKTFMDDIRSRADTCGYTDFYNKYMKFPPPGKMPNPPAVKQGCDLWTEVYHAVRLTNPCFDMYQIATTCPLLWDVLGFPGSVPYLPQGAKIYFNRKEVQKAINAPVGKWEECSGGVLGTDTSLPSALSVLPSVIDRSERTIVAHGSLDFILLHNGTLMSLQNMTWGGQQGFSKAPSDQFFVPYHAPGPKSTWAASGIMGVARTERKLTFVESYLSGHMVPQYQPTSAMRQLEFLLGRVDSLTQHTPFTFDTGFHGKQTKRDVVADRAEEIRSKMFRRDREL